MSLPIRQFALVLAVALCLIAASVSATAEPVSLFAADPPLNYWPGWAFTRNCYLDEELAHQAVRRSSAGSRRPKRRGHESADPDHVTTLGAFGGSITLKFDHTVKDDPNNAFGMDAIVFGKRPPGSLVFMEAGTIEISKDVNNNGVAG